MRASDLHTRLWTLAPNHIAIFARTIGCLLIAALAIVMAPPLAIAQQAAPFSVFRSVDENGVDLARGTFNISTQDVSIGQADGGLSFGRTFVSGAGWRHQYSGALHGASAEDPIIVAIGDHSESMTPSIVEEEVVWVHDQGLGSTLQYNATTDRWIHTSATGVISEFDPDLGGGNIDGQLFARLVTRTRPDGTKLTFHYNTALVNGSSSHPLRRVQSVTNNLGYQLHFEYARDTAPTNFSTAPGNEIDAWQRITKATAINNAVDYCNPTATSCSGFSVTWPSVTYAVSGQYQTITDSLGQITRYDCSTSDAALSTCIMVGIRRPSGVATNTNDHVTIVYSAGKVSAIRRWTGASTYDAWTYAYSGSTTTVTDPNAHSHSAVTNGAGRITSSTDALSRTTSYTYSSGTNRLTRVTAPEGNYVNYTYDSRGNVTQTDMVAKSGSGLTTIRTEASYPSSCTDSGVTIVTCNLPIWTEDARDFRTDYTYSTTHGGVLTITAPAPSGSAPYGSGTRPQTRFAYDDFTAWYKQPSSTSTPAAAPSAVYRLIEVSACATSSWNSGNCGTGTRADETRTILSYQTETTDGNNLFPASVEVTTGESSPSLSTETEVTYDDFGNVVQTNGPLLGSDDTTRTFFNLNRQVTGAIGPDPDGGGSLRYRASRVSYNADGQPLVQEVGSVTSTDLAIAPSSWTTFQSLQKDTTTYNFRGQPIRVTAEGRAAHTDSWSTSGIVQQNYLANGLPECAALRMNSADFGGGTAACTQGTGGADRITRTTYTNADQVHTVTSGHNSGAPIIQQTLTYTNNGLVSTITDSGSNRTTHLYDGHDRLVVVQHPHPTTQNTSNAEDDDIYRFGEASHNLGLLREIERRDGAQIAFAYDNLGRLLTADAPGETLDITRAYDNFSRVLTVTANSQTLTYAYDQLSRLVSEAQPRGTVSYQYDAAGQRTRVTWPDSFYVQYFYDLAGAVTQIRENGATSGVGVLATYSYDNLGRRSALTRGNNTVESYSYDTESRLAALANNLDGSSHDQTLSFSYNEASEILTRANDNTNYQWSPTAPGTTTYADNGLNQYTSIGGANPTYDARGNLTSDGTRSFTYDIYNRLISGPNSAALAYDPGGRLYEVSATGFATTRFLYDGAALVAEFNTDNTLLRRYVHGPGIDEPILWYERNGGGAYDRNWLVADERGSITAIANDAGAVTEVYSYDEYGNPPSGTWSGARFRYTGQMMLSELQLYHYKARAYDPRLGRFLQTDPIGFAGGMNLYAYVGNNPVNATDPWGLQEEFEDLPNTPPPSGRPGSGASGGGGTITVSCDLRCQERARLAREHIRDAVDWLNRNLVVAISGGRADSWGDYGAGIAEELGGCLLDAGCGNSIFPGAGATIGAVDAIATAQSARQLNTILQQVRNAIRTTSGVPAANRRTFAVLVTRNGTIIVAQSGKSFSAAERAALPAGAILAQGGRGVHAEEAALSAARWRGLEAVEIAVSRAPCAARCAPMLEAQGVRVRAGPDQ